MSQAFKDFARGMGQALDMGATLAPRRAKPTRAAQGVTISSYWRAVGNNIQHAMDTVHAEKRSK